MNPNDPTQPGNQAPAPQQPAQAQQPNPHAGYEWLSSYPDPQRPAQKASKKNSKVIIAVIAVLLISTLSLAAVFLLNNKDDSANFTGPLSNNQNSTDGNSVDSQPGGDADAKRKEKLQNLQAKLAVHHQLFGYYPTFANVTDETWLSEYNVEKDELTDPAGNDATLKSISTQNYFAYKPSPENCNNTSVKCTSYTLSAVLTNAEIYELKSPEE